MKENPNFPLGLWTVVAYLKDLPHECVFTPPAFLHSIVYLYTQTPDGAALSPLQVALI